MLILQLTGYFCEITKIQLSKFKDRIEFCLTTHESGCIPSSNRKKVHGAAEKGKIFLKAERERVEQRELAKECSV